MLNKERVLTPEGLRITYVKWWVVVILTTPIVMDFFFYHSTVARYSRVLIFLLISGSILANHRIFLRGKVMGMGSIVLTGFLYVVGTATAVIHQGVITPNIALLLLLMFILGTNIDLKKIILESVALSFHIVIFLSVLSMVFKFNPRDLYVSAEGYPVLFNFIGIPGRNYGILPHPNSLGQAATISILFMVNAKIRKIYLLAPILCLIKAGSRTSILGVMFGLLMYVAIKTLRSKANLNNLKKLESPLAVGTFIFGILLASSAQFISSLKLLDPNALTSRAQIWQASLELLKSSTIFGLGWGWEDRAIQSQFLNVWAVSAHNALLEILLSAGLVGLIVFLILLVKPLAYFNYLLTSEKINFFAILTFGISESFVDLQYPTLPTYLFFLIVVGSNEKKEIDNG
jgi:O-antigen ligase